MTTIADFSDCKLTQHGAVRLAQMQAVVEPTQSDVIGVIDYLHPALAEVADPLLSFFLPIGTPIIAPPTFSAESIFFVRACSDSFASVAIALRSQRLITFSHFVPIDPRAAGKIGHTRDQGTRPLGPGGWKKPFLSRPRSTTLTMPSPLRSASGSAEKKFAFR